MYRVSIFIVFAAFVLRNFIFFGTKTFQLGGLLAIVPFLGFCLLALRERQQFYESLAVLAGAILSSLVLSWLLWYLIHSTREDWNWLFGTLLLDTSVCLITGIAARLISVARDGRLRFGTHTVFGLIGILAMILAVVRLALGESHAGIAIRFFAFAMGQAAMLACPAVLGATLSAGLVSWWVRRKLSNSTDLRTRRDVTRLAYCIAVPVTSFLCVVPIFYSFANLGSGQFAGLGLMLIGLPVSFAVAFLLSLVVINIVLRWTRRKYEDPAQLVGWWGRLLGWKSAMILAMFIVIPFCCWYAYNYEAVAARHRQVTTSRNWKRKTGATFAYARSLDEVVTLRFGPEFGEEQLRQLKHVRVYQLEFLGSQIGDEELSIIAEQHPDLTSLVLSGTDITDKGLIYLRSLSELNTLDLSNTSVTDVGLKHVATSVRVLHLHNTKVTPAGVQKLRQLRKDLWINQRRVHRDL